ncbi:MAG: SurA N-terminal domain-containing protein [Syntrophobacterales bacterium]|nr:MAG: SurA N-terminal domain-containing protein [Syntrophobacterales bacterium]
MLKYMRTHATSWIIKVGLFFIIVVFAFYFGWGRIGRRQEGMVAKVNGQFITVIDFNQTYQNLLAVYRDRYKDRLSDEMIRSLGLKQQALDELINNILLYQEGLQMNLRVSTEELRKSIQSFPFFQVNGKFNKGRYLRLLRLKRIEPEDFEQMQKQSLLINKLRNLILQNTGIVSEEEAREAYLMENERVNLEFIKVETKGFLEKLEATRAEVEEYFSRHRESFRIPEKVNLQYMVFRPKDYRDKVYISPDEIKTYYEVNIDDFAIQEQVRARHILIKVSPDADPKKVEEARKRAAEILARAKKGENFASLAKKYSEGPTAKNGGDLDYFPRGRMVKEFEDAAFSLKPGELSSVVRTQFGFHIIKIEDVREERVQGLDEVRKSIESTLRAQKAQDLVERSVEEAFYTLYKDGEMEEVAEEYHVSIEETGFFSRGENIKDIPPSDEITSIGFSLKDGEISPVIEVSKDFYIFRLIEKQKTYLPELEEVKDRVAEELREKKAREKTESVAEELLAELKRGKPMKEAATSKGLKVEETGFFKRWTNYLPKIGFSEGVVEIISLLSAEDPYPDRPMKIGEDWVLVRFKELERPDMKQFESKRQTWETMFRYRKAEEGYQRWLAALRGRSKIEIIRDVAEL